MPDFQAPTGTRDFYPIELARLRYIQDAWRRTSLNHGFDEIDGPTFEHLDLYTVKSGEGIVSELFSFERFGGEKKYALRPEFTPTLARMYATKASSLPKPTKWFWMQNCYRAERPQRGRLREFCQWNCDIIGTDNEHGTQARADAEAIACCVEALRSLGLGPDHVRVGINRRDTLEAILQMTFSVPFERVAEVTALIDRRSKLNSTELNDEGRKLSFDIGRFLRTSASFGPGDSISQSALQLASTCGTVTDRIPGGSLSRLGFELRQLDILNWCEVDLSIARGLAYYTGMVFEVHEASGAERAIAGGGRYDGLIEMFGGPPTPAVGFGMGDVVLSLVLQDKGLMPSDDEIAARLGLRPDAFVISSGTDEAEAQVIPTLAALRRAGMHARRSYKATKNVGKLIQDAVKARARFVVILESGAHATVQNLDTKSKDENIPLAEIQSMIART